MAIWLELRCERRGEGRSSSDKPCLSDENNGPMLMAGDTKKSAALVAGELFDEAKNDGWELYKEGWICPNCLAYARSLVNEK
ncbi:hypothetical protein ABN36_18325 [Salmonella enterica subsp. enterica]|uniref:hypothetical protein n=1 Tax=Salmonella enterica TaxID=28901 RepID=UPI0009AF4654|nr:hypothetical protein [Salmonella enterica]ECH9540619.1 hypothetical protein [Salmonella enterica subsp. enterica]EGG4120945.1 hypothetical protein [Salmonella enterica]EGG4134916.1 hypothetical protein [Salmonella enterica]EGI6509435.1 hypothetical protein [Salmonella enterica subsp. enterica serovar Durham]